MILIVKRLVRKLPILLGFIFVLFFATSIKDDFIAQIGKYREIGSRQNETG
jgi:hypothetical protein